MCEYCKEDSVPIMNRIVEGTYMELSIEKSNLCSIFDNYGYVVPIQNPIYKKELIKINYCPICGKKIDN